jgi:hypothetical protein
VKNSSLPQSCGKPTIVPIASKALSKQAWRDSVPTIWTCISAKPRSHFYQTRRTIPAIKTAVIIYDRGVSLPETWQAMESLVDHGKCPAIGLSHITLDGPGAHLRSRQNQAGRRAGRGTSVSAGNRASGIPQATRYRVFSFCAFGPRNKGRGLSMTRSFRQLPLELGRPRRRC